MSRQTVRISQSFSAPVDTVFAALADHNKLGAVLGAPVKRIRDGQGDPNGLGSVRRIGPAPVGVQETVTTFEPNQKIGYRISRFGGPVKNHAGEVLFTPKDTGCEVQWTIGFEGRPSVAGPLIAKALEAAIGRGLSKLARQTA